MNTPKRRLNLHTETWTFKQPFRIANRSYEGKTFIIVELTEGRHSGRGACRCLGQGPRAP